MLLPSGVQPELITSVLQKQLLGSGGGSDLLALLGKPPVGCWDAQAVLWGESYISSLKVSTALLRFTLALLHPGSRACLSQVRRLLELH